MSVTIELEYPIESGGEELKTLVLVRPKVKHLKVLDGAKGEVEKATLLLSELSSLPMSTINLLDAADFTKASEVIGDFLGISLSTGGML